MTAGLRALLADVIDYAGLFPPAKLPLDQAIRAYARYRVTDEAWMLSRFICPAPRLHELLEFRAELFASGPPLIVSALGRGGEPFLEGFRQDLDAIAAFRGAMAGQGEVDVMEVKAPATVPLAEFVALIEQHGPPALQVFLELNLHGDWRSNVERTIEAVRAFSREREAGRCTGLGVKIRTGGLEASAFPTTEQIAFVIARCRDAGVALKATAGLHHPLRHHDAGINVMMHGFLNVFAAGVLAWSANLPETVLGKILEDENARSFVFDNGGFGWKDNLTTVDKIKTARRLGIVSFGSCSFDEPREDLRGLGLI